MWGGGFGGGFNNNNNGWGNNNYGGGFGSGFQQPQTGKVRSIQASALTWEEWEAEWVGPVFHSTDGETPVPTTRA